MGINFETKSNLNDIKSEFEFPELGKWMLIEKHYTSYSASVISGQYIYLQISKMMSVTHVGFFLLLFRHMISI